MANKSRNYTLRWHWADEKDAINEETVSATTIARAESKLRKQLAEEYEFAKAELVVIEATLV